MLSAANRNVEKQKNAPLDSKEFHLYSVAYAFCQLQSKRHDADYDLSKTFSSSVVELDIVLVKEAFKSWDVIREDQIAQDYLFSLLFKARA